MNRMNLISTQQLNWMIELMAVLEKEEIELSDRSRSGRSTTGVKTIIALITAGRRFNITKLDESSVRCRLFPPQSRFHEY